MNHCMSKRLEFLTLAAAFAVATTAYAQEAIPRPAWIPTPNYWLVYPEQFGAAAADEMLIELPNAPLKAGEKKGSGFVPMFPYHRPASPAASVAGPDRYRATPFGPVSSRLQSPFAAGAAKAKKEPSRRHPLGW